MADTTMTSDVTAKRPGGARAYLELMKPITWFAPMWAYACGVVSSGVPVMERLPYLVIGVILGGPLITGMSQVINDWYDRHVDAINEPHRPIPSGRVPGNAALWFGVALSVLSLGVAALLGPWGFVAGAIGVALAWAYSAPPLRLKLNGWWGNSACALSYEGIAWFTGAAVMLAVLPDWTIILVAVLYSAGAHGIMTLNDFKAIEGDRMLGIRTLPVTLGVERAVRVACWVMAVPQVGVIALLVFLSAPISAAVVTALLVAQLALMARLLGDPRGRAPWYNATGTTLYVLGMIVTAFALRSNMLAGGA